MAVPAISGNAGTSKTGVSERCLFNNAATPLARFAVTVENLKAKQCAMMLGSHPPDRE